MAIPVSYTFSRTSNLTVYFSSVIAANETTGSIFLAGSKDPLMVPEDDKFEFFEQLKNFNLAQLGITQKHYKEFILKDFEEAREDMLQSLSLAVKSLHDTRDKMVASLVPSIQEVVTTSLEKVVKNINTTNNELSRVVDEMSASSSTTSSNIAQLNSQIKQLKDILDKNQNLSNSIPTILGKLQLLLEE